MHEFWKLKTAEINWKFVGTYQAIHLNSSVGISLSLAPVFFQGVIRELGPWCDINKSLIACDLSSMHLLSSSFEVNNSVKKETIRAEHLHNWRQEAAVGTSISQENIIFAIVKSLLRSQDQHSEAACAERAFIPSVTAGPEWRSESLY